MWSGAGPEWLCVYVTRGVGVVRGGARVVVHEVYRSMLYLHTCYAVACTVTLLHIAV